MTQELSARACRNPKCTEFISLARLKALPNAQLCIDCQRVLEEDNMYKAQLIRRAAIMASVATVVSSKPNETNDYE